MITISRHLRVNEGALVSDLVLPRANPRCGYPRAVCRRCPGTICAAIRVWSLRRAVLRPFRRAVARGAGHLRRFRSLGRRSGATYFAPRTQLAWGVLPRPGIRCSGFPDGSRTRAHRLRDRLARPVMRPTEMWRRSLPISHTLLAWSLQATGRSSGSLSSEFASAATWRKWSGWHLS